jgi:hypothetical protein
MTAVIEGAAPGTSAPWAATLTRLRASADRLAQLREAEEAEQETRDELVCAARDEGAPWSRIAAAGRCSMARAVAIVAGGA